MDTFLKFIKTFFTQKKSISFSCKRQLYTGLEPLCLKGSQDKIVLTILNNFEKLDSIFEKLENHFEKWENEKVHFFEGESVSGKNGN